MWFIKKGKYKMVKKLTLEQEIDMLKNCINNLSVDELRKAITDNYVDDNTYELEFNESYSISSANEIKDYNPYVKNYDTKQNTLKNFDVKEGELKEWIMLKAS